MNKSNNKKYTSVSELLKNFIDDNSDRESSADVWLQIVGENLAGRCNLYDIKNETLIIEVDHPAVAQNLMFNKRQILEKVNEKYPTLHVKKIRTNIKKHYLYKSNSQSKRATTINNVNNNTGKIEINPDLPDELKSIFEKIKSRREK